MAHCGGSPTGAVAYLAGAIADDPADPEAYAVLAELYRSSRGEVAAAVAEPSSLQQFVAGAYVCFLDGDMDQAARRLGSVIGYRPGVAWSWAPWFSDERFLSAVTITGLADASVIVTDYGTDLDSDLVRECLRPWLRAIDVVCGREPVAEQMARMAILLRFCGRTNESLMLCDRADSVQRTVLAAVVRAGTWGFLGDRHQQGAALRRPPDSGRQLKPGYEVRGSAADRDSGAHPVSATTRLSAWQGRAPAAALPMAKPC